MTQRWSVHFSGNVQGVGFRYTARRVASSFRVSGYVKNLQDGRVQLVAEGAQDELQRFIDCIGGAMSGMVHQVDIQRSAATDEFEGFDIAF